MTDIPRLLSDKMASGEINTLIAEILELNPLHRRFLETAITNIRDKEMVDLGKYLEFCIACGHDMHYVADCYMTIVEDTLNEQMYFIRHGNYRYSSFAEVADAVYFNRDYMNKYMYGLAITSFLWPNHIAMSRFFQQTFPSEKIGRYLEVGPGHGYYSMTALDIGSLDSIIGVDISEASLNQTRAVLDHFHPHYASQIKLIHMDFLDAKELEANSFDILVMGEVLEHVEQPQLFLERLANLSASDAHIYVTTCINAPAIDHIYLWRNIEELEVMIAAAGLLIRDKLYLPYDGKTLEESLDQKLAVNVAYVLGVA